MMFLPELERAYEQDDLFRWSGRKLFRRPADAVPDHTDSGRLHLEQLLHLPGGKA